MQVKRRVTVREKNKIVNQIMTHPSLFIAASLAAGLLLLLIASGRHSVLVACVGVFVYVATLKRRFCSELKVTTDRSRESETTDDDIKETRKAMKASSRRWLVLGTCTVPG